MATNKQDLQIAQKSWQRDLTVKGAIINRTACEKSL